MPQSIRLTPQPAPQASAEALQVPPPARPNPGIRGNPPLPPGRVVKMIDPASLLPEERAALQQRGWTEGPVPENMAQRIAEAEALARAEVAEAALHPPVDPNTPAIQLKVVDATTLPEADQAKIRAELQAAIANRPSAPAPSADPASAAPPLVSQPVAPANAPALSPVAQQVASARQLNLGDLGTPDRPATQSVPDPNYHAPAATTAAAGEAVAPLTHCPHCRWDLAQACDAEPAEADKWSYLQAKLGDKPFTKCYRLLDGKLEITLRELSPAELDACFRQAYVDQEKLGLKNPMDFYEKVSRYRLCLQLQRYRAPGHFDHDLPDGLSPAANPHATACWEFAGSDEPLVLVEKYLLSKVLSTESTQRMVRRKCDEFNRLVERLESLADSSDFMKPTALQP